MKIFSEPKHEVKLDLYDKKIVNILMHNSRTPEKQIAHHLRISPQRVHYKINRLQQELIRPIMLLNFFSLNIPSYYLFPKKISKENMAKLNESGEVFSIAKTIGNNEYIIHAITTDVKSFSEKYLPDTQIRILPLQRSISPVYNPFHFKNQKVQKKDKQTALDKKDYHILKSLCEDASKSILHIRRDTKMDTQTIKKRIQKLENANIILRFNCAINTFRLSFLCYILIVKAQPKSQKKLLQTMLEDDYVGFISETLEGFTLNYLPRNPDQLHSFVQQLKKVEEEAGIEVIETINYLKVEIIPKKVLDILKQKSALKTP